MDVLLDSGFPTCVRPLETGYLLGSWIADRLRATAINHMSLHLLLYDWPHCLINMTATLARSMQKSLALNSLLDRKPLVGPWTMDSRFVTYP